MKRGLHIIFILAAAICVSGCLFKDYPVDEDGLIISDRSACAVLRFDLLDTRDYSALTDELAVIDTLAQTIHAKIRYRADITNLWPVFSLSTDCKLDPKVRSRQDFSQPVQYTVISGNRQVRKTYTIYVTKEDL